MDPHAPGHEDPPAAAVRGRSPFWLRILLRVARIALGAVFLVIGVAELFLPGPGTLFLLIAAILVAPDFPPARRALNSILRKCPKVRRALPWRFRRMARRRREAE